MRVGVRSRVRVRVRGRSWVRSRVRGRVGAVAAAPEPLQAPSPALGWTCSRQRGARGGGEWARTW